MLLIVLLLLPLAAGVACLACRSARALEWINLSAFGALTALALRLGRRVLDEGTVSALNSFLHADTLSALVVLLTAFVALTSGIYAVGYFRRDLDSGRITARQFHRYYTFTPLFVFAMLLVALANNLGVMWVAIEGTTLASVLLIAFYNERTSLEAAWKYIIIGSVGLTLALLGTVLTYYAAAETLGTHTAKGLNWSLLIEHAGGFKAEVMRLGFVFALLGYGTKAGLAPMHTWKPDAYSEAPVPAAALLGAGVINCAIYGIMRFHALSAKCLGHDFSGNLLVLFGIGSILVAAPFVLVQRNYRRLLAYSSIDHAGIMVAALGFGGKLGALAAVLHMLFHAVTKPLAFFCTGNVQQHFGTVYLRKVSGAARTLPWTGTLFLTVTLAMTGTPPFSIFQSEFMALSAALAAGRTWAAALFVIGVVTIFAGFLIHVSKLVLGTPRPDAPRGAECPWQLGAMLLVAAPILLLGFVLPGPLYELVHRAALMIGGGQ
jgi:hydrogenase-4 component F